MNKQEYFLKALAAGAYRYKEWVLTAFSATQPPAKPSNPYPYQLVSSDAGLGYVDTDGSVVALKWTKPNVAPYSFREPVSLKAGDLVNLKADVESTYGNALFNQIVLVYAFGDKLPYMTGRVSPRQLEGLIEPLLEDDPAPDTEPDPSKIYVSEYLRFTEAIFSMVGYTQLCVPSASPRSLQTDPRIPALRKELLEKYKDHLKDPAYVALIEKELIAMDREWLKGDETEGFYLSGKSFDVIRKKMFLMSGAESGFKSDGTVDLITNSLDEGWNVDNMPAMINSLRDGSYSRGAETALGGEAVKFLGRVFQNTAVTEEDCGAKLGLDKLITKANVGRYSGGWLLTPKGLTQATSEYLKENIGKVVTFRTPLYCKTADTGLCSICVGAKNAMSPTSLGLLASDVGSQLLGISMSKMHGVKLEVATYDYVAGIF